MSEYKIEKYYNVIHKKWLLSITLAKLFRKKVVFWGASLFLKDFLQKYNLKNSSVIAIIDKNANEQTTDFCGYKLLPPEKLSILAPHYVIYAIINNNLRVYPEVKSYLKHNHPKIKLFANDFSKLIYFDAKTNDNKIKQINNIINEIAPTNAVYLFQTTFFDNEGEHFFSGGAERYLLDLADLITNLGYKPILIQRGNANSDKPWVKTMQNLTIIGLNSLTTNYFKNINQLKEPVLAIYSGFLKWDKNIKYKNRIIISHGVTWDVPRENANIKLLHTIIENFNNIVSVDTTTISGLRGMFSNDIANSKINFKYTPNYVDINKYTPIKNTRKNIKITFPRRCCEERGFWLFANIIEKLIEHRPDIIIEFVGFVHGNDIQNKINYLKNNYPNNIVHRFCNQDEMISIYQNTDISVIPTQYSEGTSLSCLEAMACGNAVVATNIGGLPNLIFNNFNGKLINPDESSLLSALIELIDDEQQRKTLGKNAVSVAQAFSKEIWDKTWIEILKEFLK